MTKHSKSSSRQQQELLWDTSESTIVAVARINGKNKTVVTGVCNVDVLFFAEFFIRHKACPLFFTCKVRTTK